ncbi:MAG: response regulator [Firmicutes bacterium]|nr:response regulator [Bacillota bacterium]
MGPTVLIVDDDAGTLNVLKTYLDDIVNVQIASSGRQAIDIAREMSIDVILLDYEMPMMDGIATLENLRNLKTCINVPVIMITGRNDRHAVMNSIVMGIDGYLLKPISKETLIDTVLDMLKKKTVKGDKKTIVAIDDDMSYLKQINNFLQDDYHVIMINSAKLAVNYLLSHVPDVILLDYQIPLYNGVTLMKLIHQNSSCQNVPIIFLSGTLDQEAVKEISPFKPSAVLAKPVEREVLLQHIHKALTKPEQDEE